MEYEQQEMKVDLNYTTTPRSKVIVRRVGLLLLFAGSLELALMIFCITQNCSYTGILIFPGLPAGIGLLFGQARWISWVRSGSSIILGMTTTLLVTLPLLAPWNLLLTYCRLEPIFTILFFIWAFVNFGILAWVILELGKAGLCAEIGNTTWPRWPAKRLFCVAVLFAVVLVGGIALASGGNRTIRAEQMAKDSLGSNYKFFVEKIFARHSRTSTAVAASVVAWKDDEIRKIKVEWTE